MAKIFKWNPNQTATGKGVSVATIEDTATGIVEGVGMGCDRVSTKTFTDRNETMQSALAGEPAMTLKDGVLVASLEGESTNLVEYSEDFNQWTKVFCSTTSSVIQSPMSDKLADRMNLESSNSYLSITSSIPNDGDYIFSLWVKSNEIGKDINIRFQNPPFTQVNTVLNGEWQKVSVNISTTGLTSLTCRVLAFGTTEHPSELYAWGAELKTEQGSYIPTNGATQTRDADTGFKTQDISSLINLNSGVLEVEMAALINGGSDRFIGCYGDSSNNGYGIYYNAVSDIVNFFLIVDGVSVVNNQFTIGDQTEMRSLYFKMVSGDIEIKNGTDILYSSIDTFSFTDDIKFVKASNADENRDMEANIKLFKFTSNE